MSVDGDYVRAVDDLAERCLAKFSDSTASPDVRAFALDIVVSQLAIGNRAMLAHVPDICRTLRDFAAGTQTITGIKAADFYRQIIAALSILLNLPPTENHAGAWLEPVIDHFVQLVSCSCHDVETALVATVAWEFWAEHADVITHWQWMRKLLAALMDQMMFDWDRMMFPWNFDDQFPTEILSGAADGALRSVSVSLILPHNRALYTKFRPWLETRIESDSWREKEAAIRVLCAFTDAAGECSV